MTDSKIIFLSLLNTKLRDYYSSLDDLCEDLEYDKEEIIQKLKEAGYIYDENINQFVSEE